MADRALAISLPTIDEGCRRPEDEFWVAWEQAKPRVLGALLDAVAAALRHLSTTKLERTPRMADFAKWATAAEPGLGVEAGTFLKAYETNRQDSAESAFDSDQVAVAVRDFVRSCGPDGFEGTASELLAALNDWASESLQRGRAWPSSRRWYGKQDQTGRTAAASAGIYGGGRAYCFAVVALHSNCACAGSSRILTSAAKQGQVVIRCRLDALSGTVAGPSWSPFPAGISHRGVFPV